MSGKHTPRAAAMRRHPAGKKLNMRHTGATVTILRPVPSTSTATAETTLPEGTNHNG